MTAYPQWYDSTATSQITSETLNTAAAGSTVAAVEFWIYNDKDLALGATTMTGRRLVAEASDGESWLRTGPAILTQRWIEVAITDKDDAGDPGNMTVQIVDYTALGAGVSLLLEDIPPGCGRKVAVRVVVPLGASESTPPWQIVLDEVDTVLAAEKVTIVDAGGHFAGTTVEAALQELGAAGGGGGAVDSVNGQTGVVVLDAADLAIADAGGHFTATDVEGALQELGAAGGGGAVDSVNGQTGVVVLDAADLAIADAGGHFTATDVEGALQELGAAGGGGGSADGWIDAGETWTYATAADPTFTVTIAADVTAKYAPGQRVRLTQTTPKYFLITAVSYSAPNTTLTLYGGTDYDLVNAAITSPYYSRDKAPFGFPLDPDKWTVLVMDTSQRSQSSPVASTWYNLGSVSIAVPIGAWRLSYGVIIQVDRPSAAASVAVSLSTGASSESDKRFSARVFFQSAGATNIGAAQYAGRDRHITVVAATPYYLVTRTEDNNVATIFNRGDVATTVLTATSAYL